MPEQLIVRDKVRNYLAFKSFWIGVDDDSPNFWKVAKFGLMNLTEQQVEELEDLIECEGAVH